MADPFQDLSSLDAAMLGIVIDSLERRGADPQMLPIVDAYIDAIACPDGGRVVEVGAGSGAIARRIASRLPGATVHATEPAERVVAQAKRLCADVPNITFAVAPGEALGEADASVDVVVCHTVLSHVVDPTGILAEAARVLKPGGRLVVCDADWSKISLASVEGDPLEACATAFARYFVTDTRLASRLRGLVRDAGLETTLFRLDNRLDLGGGGGGGLAWVQMSTAHLAREGVIGEELAAALLGEYHRRSEAGTVYGFLPFFTLVAVRPEGA